MGKVPHRTVQLMSCRQLRALSLTSPHAYVHAFLFCLHERLVFTKSVSAQCRPSASGPPPACALHASMAVPPRAHSSQSCGRGRKGVKAVLEGKLRKSHGYTCSGAEGRMWLLTQPGNHRKPKGKTPGGPSYWWPRRGG